MPLLPHDDGPVHERHLIVTRNARYAVLGETRARPAECWFVLHGYGQLAPAFLRAFRPLDDGTRRIYAPEALNRYYLEGGQHGPDSRVGATWMTREDRLTEITDYVRYLDTLYRHVLAGLDRATLRVLVLGFSQGAATAARWTALGEARVDDLVLWGSGVPPDLPLAEAAKAWSGARVSLVYGRDDPHFDEPHALAEAERLRAHGVAPSLVGFDGAHALDAATLHRLSGT